MGSLSVIREPEWDTQMSSDISELELLDLLFGKRICWVGLVSCFVMRNAGSSILKAMQKRGCPKLTFHLHSCWKCLHFWCAFLSGNRILSSQSRSIWALVRQFQAINRLSHFHCSSLQWSTPLQKHVQVALSMTTGRCAWNMKLDVFINSFHCELRRHQERRWRVQHKEKSGHCSVHSVHMSIYHALWCWLTCRAQRWAGAHTQILSLNPKLY